MLWKCLSEEARAMNEETIFATALGMHHPAERAAYLDQSCGADTALRRRVEALLASHERVGDFLERPVVEQIAPAPPRPGDASGAEPHGGAEGPPLGFLQPP